MAKSLDGLIRHLIDQIALCGEHGESTRFLHNYSSISSYPRFPYFESLLYIRPQLLQHLTLWNAFLCLSLFLFLPFPQTSYFCKIELDSGCHCSQACRG